MLCYIYCSLAAAYAETMQSVKQERSSSQFSSVRSVSSRPSEFILQEAWQDRSPREHKSVLCVLGIEKQPESLKRKSRL